MKSNILLSGLFAISMHVSAQSVPVYSLVITEVFPDPAPAVGLPGSEFVEIYNAGILPLSLKGCKLTDGSSTAVINTSIILQPDSFLILCPSSASAAFKFFGNTVGLTNFPSLNNDKDRVFLLSPEGSVIHAIEYELSWYKNSLKEEGGWSLEMMDPKNPCGGKSNWAASTNYAGGTPGKLNSVSRTNPDTTPPQLLRSYSKDAQTLVLVFDESLDSQTVWRIQNFQLQPTGPQIRSIQAAPPFFKEVELSLNQKMDSNTIYTITVKNIRDCSGNFVGAYNHCLGGIGREANTGALVLNELLFNPPADGGDYVEVFNAGTQPVDLSRYLLCNRKSTGELYNLFPITSSPWYLFPNSFAIVTTHSEWLQKNKLVKFPDRLIVVNELPSLPDDEGQLVLANLHLEVMDELHYQHLWHHPLLANEEGVALERINYRNASQNSSNWGSASGNAGYGTPGYQNSVFISGDSLSGKMSLYPALISPDNDGMDDRLAITVENMDNSSLISIGLYEMGGRQIRQLVPPQSISGKGTYYWDGLDEQNRIVARGHYQVVVQLTGMKGKTKVLRGLVGVFR